MRLIEANESGVVFRILEYNGTYFMSLKELMRFCKTTSRQKFLEPVLMYCNDQEIIHTLRGEEQEEWISIHLVFRRVLSGKSKEQKALANWLFKVFVFDINSIYIY